MTKRQRDKFIRDFRREHPIRSALITAVAFGTVKGLEYLVIGLFILFCVLIAIGNLRYWGLM